MAKTKRKHLAALAAMTEAGIMNDDMRKKVETDQVQGDSSIQARGCSVARADADMATMAGQTLRQLADGASSSKVQHAGKVAVKLAASTLMIEHTAGGAGASSTPSIELRKQRIIIKIPPLPPKMSRKRQKIAEVSDGHVKEAAKTPEKDADKSEVDSVATKRRKIGVDVLKKNVSTLLADIDNTFSEVMRKLGDFKKERVLKEEGRDSDKLVTGPPSTGEYPRKKPKLKNDGLDITGVAVRANAAECSAELLQGNPRNSGEKHEGPAVHGDHEQSTVPTLPAPVAEDTRALSFPAAAGKVKIPRKGMQKKSAKGWKRKRKSSGSCQQDQVRSNRKNEKVKRSGAALHGRDPQKQLFEGATGNLRSPHSEQLNNYIAITTKCVVSGSQEPSTPGRSLRSRKGTPLMGPDDLPVHKRRRRKFKTSGDIPAQASGDGDCFHMLEGQQNEGKKREDVHSTTTRQFNDAGGRIMVARSAVVGNGDSLVAGHNLDYESSARDKVTTSYVRTLKYQNCQDMQVSQLCKASQSADREALEQKQKLLTILNQTAKGSAGHSARLGAYNRVLGVDRRVDIFTTKLKADGGLNAFLRAQGLEQLVPVFEAQKVDESALLQVTMDSLKQMGIHALGPRRKLISAITSLYSS